MPDLSQDELVAKVAADPKTFDKVHEIRADFVSGENKYKNAGIIDLALTTEEKEGVYEDRHNTGSFEPIWEFAETRMLKDFETEEELIEKIAELYPAYSVVEDKEGTIGVRIPFQKGKSYLWKEGAREETNFKKVETHKAKPHAEETFALKVNNEMHCAGRKVIVAGKSGEDPALEQYGSVADRSSNKSQSHDDGATHRSGSGNGSKSSCRGGGSVSNMSRNSSKTPTRLRPTLQSTPPPTPRNMSAQSDLPDEEPDGGDDDDDDENGAEEDDDAEGEEDDEQGDDDYRPTKKQTMPERYVAEAQTKLTTIEKKFGQHYRKSKQTKVIEKEVRSLRKHGRRLASYGRIAECVNASQECFDAADAMEERQTVCEGVHESFQSWVEKDLKQEQTRHLKNFGGEAICNMVTKGCAKLGDHAFRDERAAAAIVKAIYSHSNLGAQSLRGLGLRVADKTSKAVVQTQLLVAHGHLEKILKLPDVPALSVAANLFSSFLEDNVHFDLAKILVLGSAAVPSRADSARRRRIQSATHARHHIRPLAG